MGEYGREQRAQLSRAIANSVIGSRQLKGFMDNRSFINGQKLIQCRDLYRGGNNVNTTYIPRFPTDMNGGKKGLSTFLHKSSIPSASFPTVQVLDETQLNGNGMATNTAGDHVSIVPNTNPNNLNLTIWAVANANNTTISQGYMNTVSNARIREETNP